jgi:hypothetical protein
MGLEVVQKTSVLCFATNPTPDIPFVLSYFLNKRTRQTSEHKFNLEFIQEVVYLYVDNYKNPIILTIYVPFPELRTRLRFRQHG